MAGMGAFAVTAPAAGASLPAGAFDLKGTGKAGEELEIFEDGVSLGKVTVGADGTWSLNVPSPAAGAHTYTVKGPDGKELGSFKTTTLAAAASTAACTASFSLSIKDAQSVAQPFRFGGEAGQHAMPQHRHRDAQDVLRRHRRTAGEERMRLGAEDQCLPRARPRAPAHGALHPGHSRRIARRHRWRSVGRTSRPELDSVPFASWLNGTCKYRVDDQRLRP